MINNRPFCKRRPFWKSSSSAVSSHFIHGLTSNNSWTNSINFSNWRLATAATNIQFTMRQNYLLTLTNSTVPGSINKRTHSTARYSTNSRAGRCCLLSPKVYKHRWRRQTARVASDVPNGCTGTLGERLRPENLDRNISRNCVVSLLCNTYCSQLWSHQALLHSLMRLLA